MAALEEDMPIVTTHDSYLQTIIHELGHTLGGLGDEYVDLASAPYYSKDLIPYLPNLDITNDSDKIKWAVFIKTKAYQASTGIFEGGYYEPTNVYRPSYTSVMRDTSGICWKAKHLRM
jgi:hypothetical protein